MGFENEICERGFYECQRSINNNLLVGLCSEERGCEKGIESSLVFYEIGMKQISHIMNQSPDISNPQQRIVINRLDIISRLINKRMDKLQRFSIKEDNQHIDNYIIEENAKFAKTEFLGIKAIKQETVSDILNTFSTSKTARDLNVQENRGILVFGPHGSGKTLLAACLSSAKTHKFTYADLKDAKEKGDDFLKALLDRIFSPRKIREIIFFENIEHIAGIQTYFLDKAHDAIKRSRDTMVIITSQEPQTIEKEYWQVFTRRIFMGLPDQISRRNLLISLLEMHSEVHSSILNIDRLVKFTGDYSISDIIALAKEAALGPLRDLSYLEIIGRNTKTRAIRFSDFETAASVVKPSISQERLETYYDFINKLLSF